MIIPLPLVGLALASRIPFQKKPVRSLKPRKNVKFKRYTRPYNKKNTREFSLPNSLRSLIKNLSTTLSSVTRKNATENYDDVIKSYIPEGAVNLVPQYPVNVGKYVFADLDGDTQKELVTTYRLDGKNTMLVLKKQKDNWKKIAETTSSQFDTINFMSTADIAGDGREHLLIGWKTNEGHGELLGYSLKEDSLKEEFTHSYNYLEVVNPANRKPGAGQVQIALWNKKTDNSYDVDLKSWNGSELNSDKNQASYYSRKVLPYYGSMVKKMPYNPSNWYYLADALGKSGMYKDALDSIEIGLGQNPVSPSKEDFEALKDRINGLIKK